MKILVLSMEYSPEISGGVGTHVQELSAILSRTGDSVAVVACTLGKGEIIWEENRTICLLPHSSARSSTQSITKSILEFNKELAASATKTILPEFGVPDVIQCYNWLTFPAAYELRQSLRVPIVTTIHFVSEPAERWWGQAPDPEIVEQEVFAFRNSDMLITVSNSMRAIVQKTHRIPDDKIRVVYNGMDVNRFAADTPALEKQQKLKAAVAPNGEKIILYAGRMNPQKGVSAILASVPEVAREIPNVKYVFAGDPDSQQFAHEFQQQIKESPEAGGKIMLLGKLPRPKLAALYKAADLALVPSLYEPFGYAAIEAMAAGVPVIATATGGLAEIVDHEQTGLLIPVHTHESGPYTVDVPALAAATIRLLADRNFAQELVARAALKVRSVFGSQMMAEATRGAYEAVIGQAQLGYA
ncbi:MAG TPA: glycosyltransferase family 4 protein [Candidatus Angelobacter sp.]|nr:glycosyltransferase family 4 protein [Candidatus Angelobacter sp.]